MRLALLSLLLLSMQPIAAPAESSAPETLPASVIPAHYDLTISPDMKAMTFKGQVQITVDVVVKTRKIVLNAQGLTLSPVTLDGVPAQSVSLDPGLNRATLGFANEIPVGQHRLQISYNGPISKGTFGVFVMNYDSGGKPQHTLATNFEPAGARRLFPCWDEPGRKATFTVSIDKSKGSVAVSNMPIEQVAPLDGALERVRFAESPKMSTYLLFLSVGNYERIHRSVDGIDVGVMVKRGDLSKAAYALDQAAALLHYYNHYFGTPYPLPKLDLIAAPGQIEGGSMENWGAIFYSQNHLLFDPQTSTAFDQEQVFEVVSHEMAHQWFGDLVTMEWWDDLWLNEGFASWMQTHAGNVLHPEWNLSLTAALNADMGEAADALSSTHPVVQPVFTAVQAKQSFDEITYFKGAAVIAMLESYIGADVFREGIRNYIQAHAYGNVVSRDLWLQEQSVASKPILEIEHDFTLQPGVPLIEAKQEGQHTELSTRRFYAESGDHPSPGPSWLIPLTISLGGDRTETLLLAGKVLVTSPTPLVNVGAHTYARVLYSPEQAQMLANSIAGLAAVDQLNLINDAWALGKAGDAPVGNLMEYLKHLPPDADADVWEQAVHLLVAIDAGYPPSDQRLAFRRYALSLLRPVAEHTGVAARAGEHPARALLRDDLWWAKASFGDIAAIARAKSVYSDHRGSSDDQRTALGVLARTADPATFDSLLAQARGASDPLARNRLLLALAAVADPKLAARFVGVALSSEAPSGAAPGLLEKAARRNPDAVWAALIPYLEDSSLPIDKGELPSVVSSVAGYSSNPARIAELQIYAKRHIPVGSQESVNAAIASIMANNEFREHTITQISTWIQARDTTRGSSNLQ